jgi:hypothetical protein
MSEWKVGGNGELYHYDLHVGADEALSHIRFCERVIHKYVAELTALREVEKAARSECKHCVWNEECQTVEMVCEMRTALATLDRVREGEGE